MEKKEIISIFYIGIFIFLMFFSLISLVSFTPGITGRTSTTGHVSFAITEEFFVEIISPENETYYFDTSEESYYSPIYDEDLKVISNFEAFNWRYELEQTTRRGAKNQIDGAFNPNTTIQVYRWRNELNVYAEDSEGKEYSEEVVFYVEVPNSAPVIEDIDDEFYVCENNVLLHYFNSTDRDEDDLEAELDDTDPFYVGGGIRMNHTTERFRISSRIMRKNYVGGVHGGSETYSNKIYVSDTDLYDSEEFNVTAIEINNPPEIDDIGVQTVWTHGDDSIFKKQVWAEDIEDGDSDSGNLNFSIDFLNTEKLFDINETGWMYFEPNESHLDVNETPKTYNIEVCVEDRGIKNPHENISDICDQTGESLEDCQEFSLTVTAENRPPVITSHYPKNLSFEALGTKTLYFNVTTYDPDGTITDIYWYVDEDLKKYTSNQSEDEFEHIFGCGVSGNRKIKAIATDGLLNDSIEWHVDVEHVPCPEPPAPSAPSGAPGPVCDPDWVCGNWEICNNLEEGLVEGLVTGEEYRNVKEECKRIGIREEDCGFQKRECLDLNECDTERGKPSEIQACTYPCSPRWVCKDWSYCYHIEDALYEGTLTGQEYDGMKEKCEEKEFEDFNCGVQTRKCTDLNKCDGEEDMPATSRTCYFEDVEEEVPHIKEHMRLYAILLGLLIFFLVILIIKINRILEYKRDLSNKK